MEIKTIIQKPKTDREIKKEFRLQAEKETARHQALIHKLREERK